MLTERRNDSDRKSITKVRRKPETELAGESGVMGTEWIKAAQYDGADSYQRN